MMPLTVEGQPQPSGVSPQFGNILRAQQHRDAVLGAAKQSTTWIRHACASGTFKPLPTIKIWKPLKFMSDGKPLEGVWGESVEASGCGLTRLLNVVTVVRDPGVLITQVLAPGTTEADPILQKDASRYVFIASVARVPGCQQAFIDDTRFIKQEPASDAHMIAPAGVEHWTVSACGHEFTVEVKFLPLAGRTDIAARVLE
jgi:hypothetical protein